MLKENFSLHEAIDAFLLSMDGVMSPNTVSWYRWKLNNLMDVIGGDVLVKQITISDLRKWRKSVSEQTGKYEHHMYRPFVQGKLSPDTVRGFVRAARRFFKWLVDEGMLDANPAQRLEMPPKPNRPRKGINDHDRLKMLNAASGNVRDYALLKFIDDTGCRKAGAAGLTIENLDLENLRASVQEKGLGGNNKTRDVYFLEDTGDAIRDWLEIRQVTGNQVFGLSEAGIYQVFKRLAKRAGVKERWSPHQWRHACGRRWTQAGMPLGVVSQLLGHEDPAVTVEFYGQFTNSELQKLHQRYTRDSNNS